MDITWYGHSCFRLRGREAVIVTDPFPSSIGYSMPQTTADIVTVSHHHEGHDNFGDIGGDPRLLDVPGEFEISGALIVGVTTYHDNSKGSKYGKNIVYLMEMEEVSVCHLGDLGHPLSSEQGEELSKVDILMVPVGGVTTFSVAAAAEIVGLLEPKIVIPMHYRTDKARPDLDPLDKFLKEIGVKEPSPIPRLSVTKSSLPHEMQVVVLNYRA
ncbi:MAG: lactamase [Dehalococcoidia bacterium]|nr:lactamase [Dehalococcoidia bacterium]